MTDANESERETLLRFEITVYSEPVFGAGKCEHASEDQQHECRQYMLGAAFQWLDGAESINEGDLRAVPDLVHGALEGWVERVAGGEPV